MQQNHDDAVLALKIARGDSESETALFSRLSGKIRIMVRIRLRNFVPDDDQEDIISEIQEAVLRSLRKGGYDPSRGKSIEGYVAGIAGNIVAQYYRKLAREKDRETLDISSIRDNHEGVLSDILREERDAKMLYCVNKLKPKYREVLLLRVYDNKSIEEIADKLKIDRRRVSERIHYALRLLLKECRKHGYFQYLGKKNK